MSNVIKNNASLQTWIASLICGLLSFDKMIGNTKTSDKLGKVWKTK